MSRSIGIWVTMRNCLPCTVAEISSFCPNIKVKFLQVLEYLFVYRISANSFCGNYSFLKLFGRRSQYLSIKFPLHKPSEKRGNYSREEIIQGRKLFAEIRYSKKQNSRKGYEIFFHEYSTSKRVLILMCFCLKHLF